MQYWPISEDLSQENKISGAFFFMSNIYYLGTLTSECWNIRPAGIRAQETSLLPCAGLICSCVSR